MTTDPPADPGADPASLLAAADAATLIRRVGDVLGDLALAVDGLQASLGPTIAEAAVRDAGLLQEAQTLDFVSQTLRGVADFLAAAGQRRIGRDPLDFDRLVAPLTLKGLADRLAGGTPDAADGDADWF